MSFSRYPGYKESSIEWLGEVPKHWEIIPLKRDLLFLTSGSRGWADHYSDDGALFIRIGNLTRDSVRLNLSDVQRVAVPEGAEGERTRVISGDILFSITAYLGSVAVVPEEIELAYVSQHLALVRLNGRRFLSKWVAYAALSDIGKAYFETQGYGGTKVQLSLDDVANLLVPTPSIAEQSAITAFLDRETAKIDALVQEQQQLIKLLKEKRQAVISNAVTKGLDPHVPMKASGVEWLGEVPEHWEVTSLKRFIKFLDGKRIPLSSEERSYRQGTFPYYGASGIIDYIDDFIFEEDLILVGEDGANLINRSTALAFIATGQYWVNNHAHILKPLDNELIFWSERLEAIDFTPFVSGSAQPKLTIDALANIQVAAPPDVRERRAIAERIAAIRATIEPLIAEARGAITLLQERRAALISAAVTGKIDVRRLVEADTPTPDVIAA